MANEIINTRRREFLGASALVVSGALLGVSAMTTRTVAAGLQAESVHARL